MNYNLIIIIKFYKLVKDGEVDIILGSRGIQVPYHCFS